MSAQQNFEAQEFRNVVERQISYLEGELLRLQAYASALYKELLMRVALELVEREAAKVEPGHVLNYRRLYLSTHYSLTPELEEIERQIKKCEADLLYTKPPAEFIQQFGWIAYKLYKEKYPLINGETHLQESPWMKHTQVHYAVPKPCTVPLTGEIPATETVDIQRYSADIEHWFVGQYMYFAWADKINTIFWRRRERG